MDTPQLEYAGPRTPKWAPKPSPWLVAGASVALLLFLWVQIFTPSTTRYPMQAKIAATQTDVSMLGSALELFEQDTGRLPTDAEGLDALVARPPGANAWEGPYIKRGLPTDPWGNAYVYHATKPSGTKSYTLLSRGPDWTEGTPDDVVNK